MKKKIHFFAIIFFFSLFQNACVGQNNEQFVAPEEPKAAQDITELETAFINSADSSKFPSIEIIWNEKKPSESYILILDSVGNKVREEFVNDFMNENSHYKKLLNKFGIAVSESYESTNFFDTNKGLSRQKKMELVLEFAKETSISLPKLYKDVYFQFSQRIDWNMDSKFLFQIEYGQIVSTDNNFAGFSESNLKEATILTIYNALGDVVDVLFFEDKLLSNIESSPDGKFLLFQYDQSQFYSEGEGYTLDPTSGGMVLYNLKTKQEVFNKQDEISKGLIVDFFYSDKHFQLKISSTTYDVRFHKVYIDANNEKFYLRNYLQSEFKEKEPTYLKSFSTFKGIEDDLSLFQVVEF